MRDRQTETEAENMNSVKFKDLKRQIFNDLRAKEIQSIIIYHMKYHVHESGCKLQD